jgi:nicotinate phosphoribosyltransferase
MIIDSLLDTDFYKYSIRNAILKVYGNDVQAEYEFTCRNNVFFSPEMVERIREEIANLGKLRINPRETAFLKSNCKMLPDDFVYDNLVNFFFSPEKEVFIEYPADTKKLSIVIKGSWDTIMFYETFILSIINEVYAQSLPLHDHYLEDGRKDLKNKINVIGAYGKDLSIMEFGTRRRFSRAWQEEVYTTLSKDEKTRENIVGTSNVLLAMNEGTVPLGTQAHEWFMGTQAFHPVQSSQIIALIKWNQVYGNDLAIALTDTFGNEKFLKDLEAFPFLMNAYKGFRHDSGDPFDWADRLFSFFEKHNVNMKEKTLVFSDSLNIGKACKILDRYKDRAKIVFGIGTDLTFSPAMGPVVPQNVIKMTRCNMQPVCKLSANPEKAMCKDKVYLDYVRHAIKEY